ncbi:MAG TPA: hypothetical protein VFE90_10830, partial [Myxococcales bacterium]|nr:hypothetical protein [Myxococcales bacterium]
MSRLFAACLASGIFAACSVSPTGACDTDANCAAPAVCDTGRKVCALPCEPKCGIGEVCQSAKCLQQGPVVKTVSAPTTWTKRAGNVTVTASIDSGANATTSSAALHVAGQADVAGTTSETGQVRTYTFSVPGTYQTALLETPVAFTVDAVDNAGHTTLPNAIGSGQLLIDDKAPTAGGVTVNGGVTATDNLQWFSQGQSTPIDAQVTLQDGGSGIDPASLKLMSGATQISTGAPSCSSGAAAITCHFSISAQTPVIAAGAQGEVQFSIVGTDVAGNSLPNNTAAVGIDGKPPVITFTIGDAGATGVTTKYPIDGTGCVTVADATFFCGHDGKHFLRAGDTSELAFTLSDSTGTTDKGSGPGPASGTCTIAGSTSTCTVRFDTPSGTFRFPANFATATFTTTTDGTGTVSVTANAKDAAGNPATAVTIPSVAVTRVKWMRQVAPAINLAGAPLLSAQVGQVIVGGSVSAGSDPI